MLRRIVLVVSLVGCGSDASRDDTMRAGGTTSVAAARDPSASGGSASARPACPATGLWTACAVMERLDRAGLAPRLDSTATPTEPPLTAPGFLARVHNAELEVYVYESVGARSRDVARLDTTRYLGYTEAVSMQQLPTLIQSSNLVAVLHSRNDHQRERVGDALTAGPPQSPSGMPTP